MREKTVFLTGATGFVGRALLLGLLEEGHPVRSLVRRGSRLGLPFQSSLSVIEGDLDDASALRQGVAGAAVVFHLAASLRMFEKKNELYRSNIRGTENLLQACAETGKQIRFVFASSIEAVGPRSDDRAGSSLVARPVSDYGKSKLEAEKTIKLFCDTYPQMTYTILRIGNVYDETRGAIRTLSTILRKGGWRASLLRHALKDHSLSLIHLDDVVDILLTASKSIDAENKTYFAVGECLIVEKIISMLEPAVPSKRHSSSLLFDKAALSLWNLAMKSSSKSDFLTYLSIGGKRKSRDYRDQELPICFNIHPKTISELFQKQKSPC
jgi:dihydroflavonol-4-reductase